MRQYQNLPISTSTENNIQYGTRPVPVQPKYCQYQYQYQYSIYWPKMPRNSKFWEKNKFFMREIQIERSNLEFSSLKLKFDKKNLICFGKFHGCQFICLIFAFFWFGTGTDLLSTCAISTCADSVLENWTSTSTSTSTSVPKMISGLKKISTSTSGLTHL